MALAGCVRALRESSVSYVLELSLNRLFPGTLLAHLGLWRGARGSSARVEYGVSYLRQMIVLNRQAHTERPVGLSISNVIKRGPSRVIPQHSFSPSGAMAEYAGIRRRGKAAISYLAVQMSLREYAIRVGPPQEAVSEWHKLFVWKHR